jgi:hypothetical protein
MTREDLDLIARFCEGITHHHEEDRARVRRLLDAYEVICRSAQQLHSVAEDVAAGERSLSDLHAPLEAVRAHLAGAAVPAESNVFGVGDRVSVQRSGKKPADLGDVTEVCTDGFQRVRVHIDCGPTVTFLPEQLVLVRKATVK